MPAAAPTPGANQVRLGWAVLGTVTLVSAIAPLATDMYVPAFPQVGSDLAASATQVQLTLTTFFVGMALGQLTGGPVSDARGRRIPLLTALIVLVVASFVCAVSPSLPVLAGARFVQGLAGGVAMVIARAVVIDLCRGAGLVRNLNLVAGVTGIAPIVGPLLGAVIVQFSHWRMSFWVVAGLAAAMIVAVAGGIPETLPRTQRHGGGLRQLRRAAFEVVSTRAFVGYQTVMALSMGVTFAYVATSAFVLQGINGLSPLAYSVDFAANAVGLAIATLVAARLAGRVGTRSVVLAGLVATGLAGVLLLVAALCWGTTLWAMLLGFFVLMSAQGFVGPNAGALASAEVPDHPGTGSALLGFTQWVAAGLIAPVAGLGGAGTAVPMAVIVLVLVAVSWVALRTLAAGPTQ